MNKLSRAIRSEICQLAWSAARKANANNEAATVRRGVAALLFAVIGAAMAQTPPSGGTLLDATKQALPLPPSTAGVVPGTAARPALKLNDSIKVAVNAIHISGARAFNEAELNALIADASGQELTLTKLNEYAQRITRRYRDAGYLLARAYLPAQDIKDGTVEIAVLEGRLGKLHIDNQSSLADTDVAARLSAVKEETALDGTALERSLLLINDLPGIEVKSTLKPGASVGTTDLDIQLESRAPYSGTVEVDNYGNRYAGDLRLGGSLTAANMAGLADALSLRALTAEGMDYGRLAWQVPINAFGTQAGAAYSDMRYKLGHDFSRLNAHGTANIASIYLLHPFLRSRVANINGQLNYDRKELRDDVDATATHGAKKIDLWSYGASGDRIDGLFGGGLVTWSIAYGAGHLKLDAESAALDQAGHRTGGNFNKLNASLSRLQSLSYADDRLTFFTRLQLQQAGKNLDSAEKTALGGAQAVRAYPQGEAPADDAWLATLELRYSLAPDWQASLFHDAADGRLNHRAIAADAVSRRHLAGNGLGLGYSRIGGLTVQTGIAWRANTKPTSDIDRSPRIWVQAAQRF